MKTSAPNVLPPGKTCLSLKPAKKLLAAWRRNSRTRKKSKPPTTSSTTQGRWKKLENRLGKYGATWASGQKSDKQQDHPFLDPGRRVTPTFRHARKWECAIDWSAYFAGTKSNFPDASSKNRAPSFL